MTTDIIGDPKFNIGNLMLTEAIEDYAERGLLTHLYIDRHWRGDWGVIDAEDAKVNEDAVSNGGRILSAFDTPLGRIWIITEGDRSLTTVLTPDEY